MNKGRFCVDFVSILCRNTEEINFLILIRLILLTKKRNIEICLDHFEFPLNTSNK